MNPPLFVDIYHGDPVVNFNLTKQAGIVAIYHKASQGSRPDILYDVRRKLWMNGTPARLGGGQLVDPAWGAYHFFEGDPAGEAMAFLDAAQPDEETLMFVDWEENPATGNTPSAMQVREFMEAIEAKTGRMCAIYSGNAAKEEIHGKDPFFGNRLLVLAQYGTKWSVQESWTQPWGWQNNGDQYGPGPHSIPGIKGNCDNNTILTPAGSDWATNVQQFLLTWRGKAAQPTHAAPSVPVDPPTPTPVAPTGQAYNVVATVFGGRGDRQKSAYAPFGLIDADKLIAALPARFPHALPLLDVTYKGKTVTVEVGDIGPKNTNDPYWRTDTPPKYSAGIDLTPAVWDALGISIKDPMYGKVGMSWAFHPTVVAAGQTDSYVV